MNEKKSKIIEEKILKEEAAFRSATDASREIILEYLIKDKGYKESDIEADRAFVVSVSDRSEKCSIDYIVTIDGRRLMAIKCSPDALDSRERQILAFCRVADDNPIPLGVVTDGIEARVLDAATGELLSEETAGIPSRDSLLAGYGAMEPIKFPGERAEKEKRILLAFEVLACPKDGQTGD